MPVQYVLDNCFIAKEHIIKKQLELVCLKIVRLPHYIDGRKTSKFRALC